MYQDLRRHGILSYYQYSYGIIGTIRRANTIPSYVETNFWSHWLLYFWHHRHVNKHKAAWIRVCVCDSIYWLWCLSVLTSLKNDWRNRFWWLVMTGIVTGILGMFQQCSIDVTTRIIFVPARSILPSRLDDRYHEGTEWKADPKYN